ncbi:GNAT family N-acetyltransferase [Paenibacillus kobensis]|uniref:GNAT family N-acetyltransferase n=1 Tax=Paenibacillus kobensis TaxID=59841 RepID=UPI001FE48D76|nr:GNAT family N-acetyltransferase [Paenibacillus kobensis]
MYDNQELDPIRLSTDRSLLDVPYVYRYLHENMYWAKSLTYEAFERAVAHSAVVVAAYDADADNRLAGFARVISDCATFAYLTDVFIVEPYRGRGLSKKLMRFMMSHPDLQGLRRFALVTKDAHGLYEQFGFQPLHDAEKWMQIKGN